MYEVQFWADCHARSCCQEAEAARLQGEAERAWTAERDVSARFSAVSSETEFQKSKVWMCLAGLFLLVCEKPFNTLCVHSHNKQGVLCDDTIHSGPCQTGLMLMCCCITLQRHQSAGSGTCV